MTLDIKEAVATRIANSGETVANRAIEFLAEETIAKRVKQVTDAYTEIDNLTKNLRRAKPDQVSYAEDGKVISETYSKARLDERKKASDRIAKVTAAINKALDKGDWGDIGNLGNNKAVVPSDDVD